MKSAFPPPPPKQGVSVGADENKSGLGRTILIAALSAVAGAVAIKMVDRHLFAQEGEDADNVARDAKIAELQRQLAARALPPIRPVAVPQVMVPAPAPAPAYPEYY